MKEQDNNIVENKIRDLLVDHNPEFNLEDWIRMQEKLKLLPKRKGKIKTINFLKYAAAILVIGVIITVYQNRLNSVEMITKISNNELINIKLTDGTNVWLNKNTEFIYPKEFKRKKREVYLNGEAYFEVAENLKKDFIVNTSLSKIKVVGTKFNIKSFEKDNKEIVSVTEGKVHISSNNNNINVLLIKGESLNIDLVDNKVLKGQINDLNFLSWKTKKIQFINTPLNEVAKILSKHYTKKILLDDVKLNDIKLTATFNNETLSEVLEIIVLTLNVELRKEGNEIRLMLSN